MADPFQGMPRVASWIPVDHFPVPLSLYGWLGNGHTAIAMSRFGEQWLRTLSEAWEANGERPFAVRYAPHAVDDVYRPTESDVRQKLNVPADAYLVGIVASNEGSLVYDRKGFGDMAHALAMFMDQHPDAYVYVHAKQNGPQSMFLPGLFGFKGVPDERIRWADQYTLKEQAYSDEDMAAMYSAFDVLLATSRGEGFGVPVIEAQACGTPVIASNWTAQPELVGDVFRIESHGFERHPNGWLVAVDPDYDARHGADFGKPIITTIVRALEEAYQRRGDPAMRDAALAKAEVYRADRVFEEHWRPILAEMDAATKVVPLNREQRRQAMRRKAG